MRLLLVMMILLIVSSFKLYEPYRRNISGLNVIVENINHEEQLLTVKSTAGSEKYIGEGCTLDCKDVISKRYISYQPDGANYYWYYEFKDIQVGDELSMIADRKDLKNNDGVVITLQIYWIGR